MKMLFLVLFFLVTGCQDKGIPEELKRVTIYSGEKFSGPLEKVLFPEYLYKIYQVDGLGSFYVDNRVDIIKNVIRSGMVWEKEIVDLIDTFARTGTTVIDVGSHIGTHTLRMSQKVGDSGKVVAFEPQVKLFTELVMNLKLNQCKNVTCYQCVLGHEFAQVEMNLPKLDNEGGTAIGKGGDRVEMIPLDCLNLRNVSLIKIDVENTELEVLMGARKTIMGSRPVIILEIMGNIYEPIANREERVQEVLRYLEDMEYRLSYIEGSWSDWLAVPKERNNG